MKLGTGELPTSTLAARLVQSLEYIFWSILFLGALRAFRVLWDGFILTLTPHETTRPESFILHGIDRLVRGLTLYPDLGQEPYVVSVYNPLTYLPTAFFARMWSLDLGQMLIVGKALSFVATIGLLIVLFLLVWRNYRNLPMSVLLPVSVLFWHWPALTDFHRLRPESPALFFTFLGIFIFLENYRWRLLLAAGCFFIAFLIKQPFIAAPVSVALFLVFKKEYKAAFQFTGFMSAMVTVFLVTMFLLTGRNYFDNAVVSMASNAVDSIAAFTRGPWITTTRLFWGPFLATTIGIWAFMRYRIHDFFLVYLPVCILWTFYTAGKDGANFNYFAELAVVCLVMVVLAASHLQKKRIWIRILPIACLSCQVGAEVARYGFVDHRIPQPPAGIESYVEKYSNIPGPKLITYEMMAIHSREVVGIDWYLLIRLHHAGVISLDPVFQKVKDGHYRLVVLDRRDWTGPTQAWRDCLNEGGYELIYEDQLVEEYVRKSG